MNHLAKQRFIRPRFLSDMFQNCPGKPCGFENVLKSKPEGPQLTVTHELVKGTVILILSHHLYL